MTGFLIDFQYLPGKPSPCTSSKQSCVALVQMHSCIHELESFGLDASQHATLIPEQPEILGAAPPSQQMHFEACRYYQSMSRACSNALQESSTEMMGFLCRPLAI